MGKVISFLNNKGGVAKTLSTFNVGVFWASMGKKILFIDLDGQANLTGMITKEDPRYNKCQWNRTIEDAVIAGAKLCDLPILPSKYENIDFVPADLRLSNFDLDTSTVAMKAFVLADLINKIKDKYDYILMDCPPALGGIIFNALIASDGFVLVTTPDQPSIDGMHMIWDIYNDIIDDERLNPKLKFLGCLITRVENDTINKSYISLIKEEWKVYVIKPFIHKSTKLNQTGSLHVDIFSHDPNGRSAQEYMEVAKEILVRMEL